MNFIARMLACGLGSGLTGWMPGSCGSVAAGLLLYFLKSNTSSSLALDLIMVASVTAIGLWAISRALRNSPSDHDPGWIVIDEWAGMAVATIGIAHTPLLYLLAFALFRIFDITKPGPIGKLELLPGAWGVMLDDLAAGLFARLVLFGLIWALGL